MKVHSLSDYRLGDIYRMRKHEKLIWCRASGLIWRHYLNVSGYITVWVLFDICGDLYITLQVPQNIFYTHNAGFFWSHWLFWQVLGWQLLLTYLNIFFWSTDWPHAWPDIAATYVEVEKQNFCCRLVFNLLAVGFISCAESFVWRSN